MRRFATLGMLSGLAIGASAVTTNDARAHFRLEAPAVATEMNDLGDPQKTYPCGGDAGATMTGDLTTYSPGDTITITVNETIYHPGHYRVALAENDMSELPADPPITPGPGDECAMTEIMNPPVYPVLADGMLPHDAPFDGEQSFQVTLPDDVECENCTLQVIQYMSSHGAPCFYYHCANIAIQGGASGESTGDPTGGSTGDATTGEPDPTTGDPDPTADPTAATSDGNSAGETADPTAGATATDTAAGTGTDGEGQDSSGGGGGCSIGTQGAGGAGMLALLPLLFAARRRR